MLGILLGLITTLPANPGKENNRSNLAQHNSDNNGSPSATVINNQTCPPNKEGTNTQPPNWYTSPEWWLCILGLPTLIFIGWQARATADAAKATQESAKATAEQSKNMMAQERARLSIIFPPNDPRFYGLLIEDVDGKTYQSMEVFLDIINEGETKAFNVKASGYILIEPIQTGKAYASYGDEFTIPKVIRNATIDTPVRVAVCPADFGTSIQIRSDDCVAIQKGRKPLHIVGTISYEDVFGKPHHTPFWYTWQVRIDENWGNESGWTDHSSASD